MAQSTCPACKGTRFEYKHADVPEIPTAPEIPRVPIAVDLIQCADCGCVIGVLEARKPPHP